MSKAKALELQQKLQKLPKNWPENKNRVLIREGVLFIEEENKLKPRWCFLFNDCFLECKPACEFADNFTRLTEPHTPYRFKNYIMLNTCYIQENPNTIKKLSKEHHKTQPFIIIGHNIQDKNKKNERLLIYSSNTERELWCSDIHRCICNIHSGVNNDIIKYGWHNEYRKGTIFDAVYTANDDLLKQLSFQIEMNESIKDIGGHNLLHLAMAINNIHFIQDYGALFNIDDVDINGWSALRIGCDNNSFGAVRVLTEELYPNLDEYYPSDGVDIKKELDDRTILHELCFKGQSQLVEILLNTEQINMEALDKNGCTPLHIAAKKNEEQCVILLLQNGAPPNLADFKGNRALHYTNKELIARWLIAYGARLELVNESKKGHKFDKYIALLQILQATDCVIQSAATQTNAWFDDKLSNSCLLCGSNFTVFSRRHHCRGCGLLVCQQCSIKRLLFKNKDNKMSTERACDKCFNKNHCKLLRKKEYVFKDKKYNMRPKEFYVMCVMEATLNGSYNNKQIEAIDEKESNHTLSKSLGFMNKKIKRKHAHQAAQSEAFTQAHKALNKAQQRGEKLAELQLKSDQMTDAAQNFNDLAKQLANKKW